MLAHESRASPRSIPESNLPVAIFHRYLFVLIVRNERVSDPSVDSTGLGGMRVCGTKMKLFNPLRSSRLQPSCCMIILHASEFVRNEAHARTTHEHKNHSESNWTKS